MILTSHINHISFKNIVEVINKIKFGNLRYRNIILLMT